jgi:tetratricopeptide (TPR) repeat protein/ketosteroid isomerase-like protein
MRCAACQSENPPGKKFCGDCGAALGNRCPRCGADNPATKRFCGDCGAPIVPTAVQSAAATGSPETSTARGVTAGSQTVAPETRKVITVVFADLMGSTALQERLDPESVNRVMDAYYRAVRGPVEAAGGTVVQLLGDGVLCAFGIPRIAEDDALRAVRAAVGIQRAFREFLQAQPWLTVPIGLRVAVNTGEVVVSDEHPAGIGDPLNVAARLQQEARDGEVLIGQATRRLVADAVTLERAGAFVLKGRAETVTAYRVVSLERPTAAASAIFVGRDEELARIGAVYEAAVAKRAASLAVVLGSPGLGKSRLIAEIARRLGDAASVVHAQCDAAGGATFAPVAEALRKWLAGRDSSDGTARTDPSDPAGVRAALETAIPDDADRGRIAAGIMALLAGSPASPEETFFVIRRFLAALAEQKPLVLVIDDLHWAEPLLLDLVEHLIQWGSGVPMLVLVGARPELRGVRSSLVTPGGLVADVVTLSGLDAGAATRLAASVIGASDLPAVVAAKVLATSEGNPLFVRELVRMLVEEGAIERQGERWVLGANLAALEIPPTIHALLAARIERLRPEERMVLERAAVVGRHFSRSAVAALLGRNDTALDARLEALRRTELIERDTGWFLGEPALRFHHVLIRDAAYRRLLKGTRAELHQRVTDWIEAQVGDAAEHDETIGWHLEQAHRLLGELGPLDAAAASLGERAARRLAAAGRRALARDDLVPAASLLGRALDRLGADDQGRADLVLDWCEALLASGDVATTSRAIAELGRMMADSERLRAWHACFSGQLAVLTDPDALRAAEGAVAAAAETLTAAGDTAGEAKAHSVHALVLAQLGQIGACEVALDRALAAARRVRGERRLANAVLAGAPLAALWGPSPVTRASGRCLDVVRVLRITQGAPAVEAVALRCQAVLETLRGRGEAARRMIASSRKLVEELGITQRVLEADLFAGLIELLEGAAPGAERWLRSAWDGLRDQGLGIAAAQAGALLARALLAQGRVDEAETVSRESESLAGDSFQAAIAWRGVRAEVLAARGDRAAAIAVARAAVEIAAATDDLLDHADARASLAVALRAAGRGSEAEAEQRRAIELWEAKGATLLVERARRVPARVSEPPARASAAAPARRDRRVRENAATANDAHICAAIAARDAEGFATLISDTLEVVYHPTGTVYGGEEGRRVWRSLIEAPDGMLISEPLATLGDSLVLCRVRISASGFVGMGLDMGAVDFERIVLAEVDDQGRRRRAENFDADKLAAAVARLYERHAELLPEGAERTRAAGIARRFAVMLASYDPDAFATAWAPTIEYADHRTEGAGALHGVDATREWLRNLLDVAEGVVNRLDEILCVRSDALLVRMTNSGTLRASRGAYERPLLLLLVFGSEGFAERMEVFDPEREADAFARLDALTAPSPTPRAVRRVRPNPATASAHRLREAIVARDTSALPALVTDDIEVVYHPTHLVHGAEELLRVWRSYIDARDGTFAVEPLATLGDSLALCRFSFSASGASGNTFDVGPFENERISVYDVDDRGRRRHTEVFADDRLGDAIVRLYERHAELLPEGPERTRAETVARAVTGLCARSLNLIDLERLPLSVGDDVELVDRRTLGFGSLRGIPAFRRLLTVGRETARDVVDRVDEVLDARADALLLRITNSGIDRTTSGAFERPLLRLGVFGADGRLTRVEQFDVDREAEALARFDELTTPRPAPVRRVRANSVMPVAERMNAAIRAGDLEALGLLIAEGAESVDHTTGLTFDRSEVLAWFRLFGQDRGAALEAEPLATLGDRLMLSRSSWTGGSDDRSGEVGPWRVDFLTLTEVGTDGRVAYAENFASDQLAAAVVRLYERHARLLPNRPERTRAAATARSAAVLFGPIDLDRFAAALAPAVEFADDRTLGFASARGAEALLGVLASLLESAPDATNRLDDVVAVRDDAFLVRITNFGTSSLGGGAYERPFLILWTFGADGLVTRSEQFDPGREKEALARFDELARPGRRRRVRPNAVTADIARLDAAMAARDAEALRAIAAEQADVVSVDHPIGYTYDAEAALATRLAMLKARDLEFGHEPLATIGDGLALLRMSMSASGVAGGSFDVGPYARELIILSDGPGRRAELFDADRLGDAIVRLYERLAEILGDTPSTGRSGGARAALEPERAAATARSVAALLGSLDPERWAAAIAPDAEFADRRTLGLGVARGAGAVLRGVRSIGAAATDLGARYEDVLALEPDALLVRVTSFGTDRTGGGRFERPFLLLLVFGADGLLRRGEQFDPDREAEALARFDALAGSEAVRPAEVFANAASRSEEQNLECWAAHDWAGVMALYSPAIRFDDRRRLIRLEIGAEDFVAQYRMLFDQPGSRWHEPLLATRGERLSLHRVLFQAEVAEGGGALELDEHLGLIEVDVEGRQVRLVAFDLEDEDAAYAELDARWQAGEAAAHPLASKWIRDYARCFATRDWNAMSAIMAPDVVSQSHRLTGWGTLPGSAGLVSALQAQMELAPDTRARFDHLRTCEGGVLLQYAWLGTRDGGAFEIPFVALVELDALGRARRIDVWEPEQLEQAWARFEALTDQLRHAGDLRIGEGFPPRPVRRRVRPNLGTACHMRAAAALAARDVDAFVATFAADAELVDHPTGITSDVPEIRRSWRLAFERTPRHAFATEVIATLGEQLVLARWNTRGSASSGGRFDVGGFEFDDVFLSEVDDRGLCRGSERFTADRLRDAVARLYERYAALLPEGPERSRAAGTARAIAAFSSRHTVPTGLAPGLEFVDHRPLGFPASGDADAFVRLLGTLAEETEDSHVVWDEILDLRPGALLVRGTNKGTLRDGGGAFERPFLHLWTFTADGILARFEVFDPEHAATALARFDALVAETHSTRRCVRPNAATANAARLDAAIAKRDGDAVAALYGDSAVTLHHPTGVEYDRAAELVSLGSIGRWTSASYRQEPLATLGDRLALCRATFFVESAVIGAFDFGAVEREAIALIDVDAEGRRRRTEIFAHDRLGNAISRLYERYAALCSTGAERARAAAVARSAATLLGPLDADRYATVLAPDVERVDHRSMGLGAQRGREALVEGFRALEQLSARFEMSIGDILALRPDALVVRWINRGTLREGGGAYERVFLVLVVFGADGLVAHDEWFDPDRETEALARFDALATAAPPAWFENAATRSSDRVQAAANARDWDRVAAELAPGFSGSDRRRLFRQDLDRNRFLAALQLDVESYGQRLAREVLATRGDRLALFRLIAERAGEHFGPSESEWINVVEVDAGGRRIATVAFDPDDVDAAYAELDARWQAGEAQEHPRSAAWVTTLEQRITERDWDGVADLCAPSLVAHDHRLVGWGTLRGPAAFVESMRAMVELSPDAHLRTTHVRTSARGHLVERTWLGTRDGGAFESPYLSVAELDERGQAVRIDFYDPHHVDAALARFAELARAAPPTPRIENVATRFNERTQTLLAARDLAGLTATLAPALRVSDRRRLGRLELDRDQHVESLRFLLSFPDCHVVAETLATRGRRLALFRQVGRFSGRDAGPSELEHLLIIEVDGEGEHLTALVFFDLDALDAAHAELDARYAAGEGAPHVRALTAWQRFAGAWAARDWDAFAATLAPDFRIEDHRKPGLMGGMSRGDYVASARALVELRPDVRLWLDHVLALDDRRALQVGRLVGADADGSFETAFILVPEYGGDAICGWHVYDVDDLDAARAHYEALGAAAVRPDPLASLVEPNAASAATDRFQAAVTSRDWPAVQALLAEGATVEDRRRHVLVSGDADWWLRDLRNIAEITGEDLRFERTLVATAGDRLCLDRVLVVHGPAGGRIEVEALWLAEIDATGRVVAGIAFDADDRRAAYRELVERHARSEEGRAMPAELHELRRAFLDRDLERARAALPSNFAVQDHRRTRLWRIEGRDAWIAWLATLYEQSPDAIIAPLHYLAVEEHGCLSIAYTEGTLPEGGAFEQVFVSLFHFHGGRVAELEMFEVEDLDRARARFEALRPAPAAG